MTHLLQYCLSITTALNVNILNNSRMKLILLNFNFPKKEENLKSLKSNLQIKDMKHLEKEVKVSCLTFSLKNNFQLQYLSY